MLRPWDRDSDEPAGPTAVPRPAVPGPAADDSARTETYPPARPPPSPIEGRTPEQQEIARRAISLLDDAIAETERRLGEARAANNAILVRELEVRLERLRAARQQRAQAAGQ